MTKHELSGIKEESGTKTEEPRQNSNYFAKKIEEKKREKEKRNVSRFCIHCSITHFCKTKVTDDILVQNRSTFQ